MNFLSEEGKKYLETEYVHKERSLADIARENNTNISKICRAMVRHGIARRGRSEAQGAALRNGRHEHPTNGKKRDEKVRLRISESMTAGWQKLTERARRQRTEAARATWGDRADKMAALAHAGLLRAAHDGSAFERFLVENLEKSFRVEHGSWVPTPRRHVRADVLVADLRVVIQVDGPAHHLPVWGEKSLARRRARDEAENTLLITAGYSVIRVKCVERSVPMFAKKLFLEKLLASIMIDAATRLQTIALEVGNVGSNDGPAGEGRAGVCEPV